jgi:hypothetical protein
MNITNQDRLDLKRIMDNQDDYQDNTDYIRNVKHSVLIHQNIESLEKLKIKHKEMYNSNPEEFRALAVETCPFLSSNYVDIFNKILKNEIDLNIMVRVLSVLKMIEDGKLNQEEGSIMVGKLLKEMYIDSAIRTGDNLDKMYESSKPVLATGSEISWKQWKTEKK